MNKNHHPPVTLLNTHTRMLHSEIVGDAYELSIYLPPSYESSEQAYPTLYVLDAPMLFSSAITAVLFQNWQAAVDIPEMIIVGVGKRINKLDEWTPIRWRDYAPAAVPDEPGSGKVAEFLNFFDQELIPFIDANYNSQPNDRIIWGGSLSGTFVLYAMFNKTHLFTRYIAIAPSFVSRGQTLLDYGFALATESLPSEARLFVSIGSLDSMVPSVQAFISALTARALPNLKYQTSILDGLGHAPAMVPAFIYGIELFTPCDLPKLPQERDVQNIPHCQWCGGDNGRSSIKNTAQNKEN